MESRIYIEDNVISKTFSSFITNSLLYTDVLAFKRYLDSPENIGAYAQSLEYSIMDIIYRALNSKGEIKNNNRLTYLFQASLTYIDESRTNELKKDKRVPSHFSPIENRYFLDIACLAIWEDHLVDFQESDFIRSLGNELELGDEKVTKALQEVAVFF